MQNYQVGRTPTPLLVRRRWRYYHHHATSSTSDLILIFCSIPISSHQPTNKLTAQIHILRIYVAHSLAHVIIEACMGKLILKILRALWKNNLTNFLAEVIFCRFLSSRSLLVNSNNLEMQRRTTEIYVIDCCSLPHIETQRPKNYLLTWLLQLFIENVLIYYLTPTESKAFWKFIHSWMIDTLRFNYSKSLQNVEFVMNTNEFLNGNSCAIHKLRHNNGNMQPASSAWWMNKIIYIPNLIHGNHLC